MRALPRTKILFVDDEPNVLDAIRRMLRHTRQRWDLRFETSVDGALDVLEEGGVEVVVTDLNMPRRDGFELLRVVREDARWNMTPVIILTGNGEGGLKRRALELGATDLLNKPTTPEDLEVRIESVLRIKAYQDEIRDQNRLLEERVQQRTAQLEATQAELVWRLGRVGEYRDSDTGYHVVRVGFFARSIARALGADEEYQRRIFLTAPLHDLGKIGIPDAILLKPGGLDASEWETMRTHSRIGAEILRGDAFTSHRELLFGDAVVEDTAVFGNPFVEMAARIAEGHHEQWGGGGYPDGARGEEIPLEARITTIADVYDALCSRRPYKEPFSQEEVSKIMQRGRGTQFDPDALDAFFAVLPDLREIRERFQELDDEIHPDMSLVLEELKLAA